MEVPTSHQQSLEGGSGIILGQPESGGCVRHVKSRVILITERWDCHPLISTSTWCVDIDRDTGSFSVAGKRQGGSGLSSLHPLRGPCRISNGRHEGNNRCNPTGQPSTGSKPVEQRKIGGAGDGLLGRIKPLQKQDSKSGDLSDHCRLVWLSNLPDSCGSSISSGSRQG